MTSITRAEVSHLARLARLALTDDELEHFAAQLDVILASVARVSEIAADDIPPTSHSVPLTNVFRPDVVTPSLTPDEALAQAPSAEDSRFRVPRMLDEEA
jgi:aspartyl-tRNA(Asn)/glutamyl-tRNA(Gln) amidotransferase subunit C